jgi:multisubunit Na+/H+ antiporter MnhE subunit
LFLTFFPFILFCAPLSFRPTLPRLHFHSVLPCVRNSLFLLLSRTASSSFLLSIQNALSIVFPFKRYFDVRRLFFSFTFLYSYLFFLHLLIRTSFAVFKHILLSYPLSHSIFSMFLQIYSC